MFERPSHFTYVKRFVYGVESIWLVKLPNGVKDKTANERKQIVDLLVAELPTQFSVGEMLCNAKSDNIECLSDRALAYKGPKENVLPYNTTSVACAR